MEIKDLLETLAYYEHITGKRTSHIKVQNMGQAILPINPSGLAASGKVEQMMMDQGVLHLMQMEVSAILGCGHTVSKMKLISGICMSCFRICCARPGCLAVCCIEGITVCRQHYSLYKGYPVSTRAQRKGLWRGKVKDLERNRRLLDETSTSRKLLPRGKQS